MHSEKIIGNSWGRFKAEQRKSHTERKKRMKKAVSLIMLGVMALSLDACGSAAESTSSVVAEANESVTETDYVRINGIYVDNSYENKENDKLKMVYVFYDAFTNAENLSISSKSSKLTINGVNTYSSEHYSGACDYMESYYDSDYIEHVYVGDSLKVVSTFKVPSGDLAAGRSLAIEPYGIPDADKLKLTTDDIIFCDSKEEIAQAVDPDGYASYTEKYKVADEETTEKVKEAINGYYWDFYVNNISYEIEFMKPNKFELRVAALGVSNSGTYVVRNGFVSVTMESNNNTVDIPWTWGDDDIDLDVCAAYDVKS